MSSSRYPKHYFIELEEPFLSKQAYINCGYVTHINQFFAQKKVLVKQAVPDKNIYNAERNVQNDPDFPAEKIDYDLILRPFFDVLTEDMVENNGQKNDTLLYIHGMFCDFPPIHALNLQHFEAEYLSKKDFPHARTLSIIYHVNHPYYPKNHRRTAEIANVLAPIFQAFCAFFYKKNGELESKIQVLCHSMGNQLLAHLLKAPPQYQRQNFALFSHFSDKKLFGSVIMAAPDVDSDIFDAGKQFENLPDLAENIQIYFSRTDAPLIASSIFHGKKRLGRHGVPDITTLKSNVYIIDATAVRDNRGWHARANGHIYYHASPTVVRDIQAQFLNKSKVDRLRVLD
ncbi:MAG: alpha/beta hydrolase [Saprospiraceae bacterium]|nr:alpha/beta hydrolase [Saprospiraceae bacterium]